MTILIAINYNFSGELLENIKIPGANLKGAIFDNTTFKGCNLENVIFANSYLNNTSFIECNMNGVKIGEDQVYKGHRNWISVVVYDWSSKLMATGSDDCFIYVWDM